MGRMGTTRRQERCEGRTGGRVGLGAGRVLAVALLLAGCATPYFEVDDAVELEDGQTRFAAFAERDQGPFFGGVEGVDVRFLVDGREVVPGDREQLGPGVRMRVDRAAGVDLEHGRALAPEARPAGREAAGPGPNSATIGKRRLGRVISRRLVGHAVGRPIR